MRQYLEKWNRAWKTEKGKLDWFKLVSWLVMATVFGVMIYLLYFHINALTNSDDASELVLGRLLASENRIMSKNWYYSTEIRVLNTQIIYAFWFKMINDWHLVRILSLGTMYIMLIASCIYYCKSLKCSKCYILLSTILVIPFSRLYYQIILQAAYYIPHICISFVTLGLIEHFVKHKNRIKSNAILWLGFVLAIVAGMGGPRQLIILYLPLFVANGYIVYCDENLRKRIPMSAEWQRYSLIVILYFVGGIIGYGINSKILTRIYHFKVWDDLQYVGFDFANLWQIISGFMNSYGYLQKPVFSLATITNATCGLMIVATLLSALYGIRHKENSAYYRLSVFSISAVIVYVLLFLFTNMSYTDRYNLPIVILSIPLLLLWFHEIGSEKIERGIVCGMTILLIISSFGQYQYIVETDNTKDLRKIADRLVSENYASGYATFWNSNVLTELSNGKVDMWNVGVLSDQDFAGVENLNHYFSTWLQKTSHGKIRPVGKAFLLLSTGQYEACNWKTDLLDENLVYKSKKYVVYGYEDYEHFPSAVKGY